MAPKRFVLVGHAGFHNRGCEAIVRTTTRMLWEQFPGSSIVLASANARNDGSHPAAEGLSTLDNWGRRWTREWFGWQIRRVLRMPIPPQALMSRAIRRELRTADAILQIGGDNFTSDYGLSAGSGLIGCNQMALRNDIPLVFWGVSVGPFTTSELEELVLSQMREARLITVREGVSEDYLRTHDIKDNVVRVADPAFLLSATPVDLSHFWPKADKVLAINVSALSSRYRHDGNVAFGQSVARGIIDEVLRWDDWGVLLLPHVAEDHEYMLAVKKAMDAEPRVRLCPPSLDACETKYIISQCDALIAARTHATIAGFSSGVPTVSLGYSRKAYGLNLDIFGHDEWLLDIVNMPDVNAAVALIRRLSDELGNVRAHLKRRMPELQQAANRGVERLAGILRSGTPA